jgi:hypothetical protein
MTFEQLFNHMERYIEIPEERWKLVTRVKRGISDPHSIGCYSRDQCYFEGAVDILENLERIDFYLLMSGKLCLDELHLVKKAAKISTKLKIPKFMRDIKAYKQHLREIGIVNGIIEPPPDPALSKEKSPPPPARKPRAPDEPPSEAKVAVFQEIEDIIIENNIKIDNLKEYREMFEKNNRLRTLTSIQIKNYITNEIVASTKNTAGASLKSLKVDERDSNSALCSII